MATGYTFGDNLKYYRLRKDMTLKELAGKLNVTPVTVWKWENEVTYPTIDRVYDIALILCIAPLDLINKSTRGFRAGE
jgi:transcriptional regulator with XRE-family HTH domain